MMKFLFYFSILIFFEKNLGASELKERDLLNPLASNASRNIEQLIQSAVCGSDVSELNRILDDSYIIDLKPSIDIMLWSLFAGSTSGKLEIMKRTIKYLQDYDIHIQSFCGAEFMESIFDETYDYRCLNYLYDLVQENILSHPSSSVHEKIIVRLQKELEQKNTEIAFIYKILKKY